MNALHSYETGSFYLYLHGSHQPCAAPALYRSVAAPLSDEKRARGCGRWDVSKLFVGAGYFGGLLLKVLVVVACILLNASFWLCAQTRCGICNAHPPTDPELDEGERGETNGRIRCPVLESTTFGGVCCANKSWRTDDGRMRLDCIDFSHFSGTTAVY
jgi:hypothetical protein